MSKLSLPTYNSYSELHGHH